MEDSIHLFKPGHTACAGCGQSMAARLVIDAAGPNTIVVNNTGCLEVFSTKYPETAWNVPWIHSLFENSAAIASGIEAALRYLGKKDGINVICEAGDGGTADIGLQALSGMWERGQDILSVCANEGVNVCPFIGIGKMKAYSKGARMAPWLLCPGSIGGGLCRPRCRGKPNGRGERPSAGENKLLMDNSSSRHSICASRERGT